MPAIVFAGTDGAATIDGWREADFVFVPHTLSRWCRRCLSTSR
jgi:hypothetical protein